MSYKNLNVLKRAARLRSAAEVETQVYIGAEIGYISKPDAQAWVSEAQAIQAMLVALIKHVAAGTSRQSD